MTNAPHHPPLAKPLTKSSLAEHDQCEKRFWLSHHRPDVAVAASGDLFIAGNRLGALARALVPDGVLVSEISRDAALARTQSLIHTAGHPIFEAAFEHEGVFVRTDVLTPGATGWHLAEVKATTGPKPHHLTDLATQVWVAQSGGLTVETAAIRHVDTRFRYRGDGDYAGLLTDTPAGSDFDTLVSARALAARSAAAVRDGGEPARLMGDHCTAPYACPYIDYCGAGQPKGPDYPVYLLPGSAGKKAAAKLIQAGYEDLRDVPADHLTASDHLRIHAATQTGAPFHDHEGFAKAIAAWAWPRYYLDFETIAQVIPQWTDRRPFEQVPFQFSCHVENQDGTIDHIEYLDVSGAEPARAEAEALLEALGTHGAIVTYNLPTERGAIRNLAERCPDLAPALEACIARLVDLLPLVKAHYYHPDMKGSYSIKKVLPAAVPDLSYKHLKGVQDGMAAQAAWVEASDVATSAARRDELKEQMFRYCQLDTWAMVRLAHTLSRLATPDPAV